MQKRLWIGLGLFTGICALLLPTGCEDNGALPPPEPDWSLYAGHWVGTGLIVGGQRTITVDISSEDGTVTLDDPGSDIESLPWNEAHYWDLGAFRTLTFTSPTEGSYKYNFDTIALHRE